MTSFVRFTGWQAWLQQNEALITHNIILIIIVVTIIIIITKMENHQSDL